MIGPVSGTGRAMMASLQQAMAKGMPPDQAIQYVKSMAMEGVAPLADLYAMMNQFQRLKEQKAQAPQTPPTIKDQLAAMDRQGVDPSMLQAMPQGQQGQQRPQPQQAPQPRQAPPSPMEQGLGGMNAGSMERAQFAGGGIVAFQEGGGPADSGETSALLLGGGPMGAMAFAPMAAQKAPRPLTTALAAQSDEDLFVRLADAAAAEDQAAVNDLSMVLRQRNRRDLVDQAISAAKKKKQATQGQQRAAQLGFPSAPAAPAAPPPAPAATTRRPSVMGAAGPAAPSEPKKEDITEAEYQKLRAFREREGLGAARGEMRQFLTDEEKRLEKTYGQDQRLAFAEMGFRMAQAASRPGATFLGALSEGAMSATQALKGINKELSENKRLLKQSMIKLKEAEELEKEGDYKAAMGLNKEARAEALKLYELRENLKLDREKIAATRESTSAAREATQFAQSESREIQRLRLARENLDSNPQYAALSMQATAAMKDPEKYAQIRAQMTQMERAAKQEAGLPTVSSEAAAQPGTIPRAFIFDPKRGLVDAETGLPYR